MSNHRSFCLGVYGNQGGAGRSIVALNLAAAFCRIGRRSVVVEADFEWGGGLKERLGLPPEPNMSDIVAVQAQLSPEELVRLCDAGAAKPALLGAPSAPASARTYNRRFLQAMVAQLRAGFDVIVLDLPARLEPRVVTLLGCVDSLLWLSLPSAAALRRAAHGLRRLDWLRIAPRRVALALNRAQAMCAARAYQITRMWPIVTLPEEPTLADHSAPVRPPVALVDPQRPFARALTTLAEQLWPSWTNAMLARERVPIAGGDDTELERWAERILARVDGEEE